MLVLVALSCLAFPAPTAPAATWVVRAGMLDVSDDENLLEIGLERRFAPRLHDVRPALGILGTANDSV